MELLEHYKLMLTMRHFEEACLEGVPTGEIHGELHTGIGQEAIGGAMAGILRRTDALVSTHRNHLHAIAKGVRLKPLLAEIFERSTGLCKGRGGHMHPFDLENNFSASPKKKNPKKGSLFLCIPCTFNLGHPSWHKILMPQHPQFHFTLLDFTSFYLL